MQPIDGNWCLLPHERDFMGEHYPVVVPIDDITVEDVERRIAENVRYTEEHGLTDPVSLNALRMYQTTGKKMLAAIIDNQGQKG